MDAATITAVCTGAALVLKALAVLVTALRLRQKAPPDAEPEQHTPEHSRV